MVPDGLQEVFAKHLPTRGVVACFGADPPLRDADRLDLACRREVRPPVGVLQRADVVADRRGARLFAAVSAPGLLMGKHFPGFPGIPEPILRILVERSLVALQRQDAVPALAGDQLRGAALHMHRVSGDDRALDVQHLEQRRKRTDLVGFLVDCHLPDALRLHRLCPVCGEPRQSRRERTRNSREKA